jgi:hypothetical protein
MAWWNDSRGRAVQSGREGWYRVGWNTLQCTLTDWDLGGPCGRFGQAELDEEI